MFQARTSGSRGARWAPLAFALALGAAQVAVTPVPEYAVKAALIFKIGKFVRWPDAALQANAGTLHVCIVGRDDFGEDIDALAGQRLQGQSIAIDRLPHPEQSASGCTIVFISRSEHARLPAVLAALAGHPALSVSDIDGFAAQGGMVGLATQGGRVSFQINPAAATRAGLEIGAQLLQLATVVGDQHGEASP